MQKIAREFRALGLSFAGRLQQAGGFGPARLAHADQSQGMMGIGVIGLRRQHLFGDKFNLGQFDLGGGVHGVHKA